MNDKTLRDPICADQLTLNSDAAIYVDCGFRKSVRVSKVYSQIKIIYMDIDDESFKASYIP